MTRQPPDSWKTDRGPFDIIGDVHGCARELEKLLNEALEKEDYEKAAKIRDEISKRKR